MAWTYDFPHPAVTVDIVVFSANEGVLQLLLVERADWPFKGRWALPGGFVGIDESLRRAALRELREETGVRAGFLEQLGAFGHPDRDPRERVVTVAYVALLRAERMTIRAGGDATDARLFAADELPELAFDHDKIVRRARARLRAEVDERLIVRELMPATFTLSELQRVAESVTGSALDKRNFRKKVLALDLVEATGRRSRGGAQRPAMLFAARAG